MLEVLHAREVLSDHAAAMLAAVVPPQLAAYVAPQLLTVTRDEREGVEHWTIVDHAARLAVQAWREVRDEDAEVTRELDVPAALRAPQAPEVTRESPLEEVAAWASTRLGLPEKSARTAWQKRFAGFYVIEDGALWLTYPKAPQAPTRDRLKRAGFRWDKEARAWRHAGGGR